MFEHFDGLIATTKRRLYYCSTKGFAYSVDRFSGKKTRLQSMIKDGRCRISIHGSNHSTLKHCVYYVATGHWPTIDENVRVKDGNELNCAITNLELVKRADVSRITGPMSRSKAVVVVDRGKDPVEYRSIRKAANALYCSYQTLSDYLNGKAKKSVLKKYGRKIYLKEAQNG